MRLLYDWGAWHQNGTLLQSQTCCIQIATKSDLSYSNIVTKSDLSYSNCLKLRLFVFNCYNCCIQRTISGDGLGSKRRESPIWFSILTSTRCILAVHCNVACSLRKVYLAHFTKQKRPLDTIFHLSCSCKPPRAPACCRCCRGKVH